MRANVFFHHSQKVVSESVQPHFSVLMGELLALYAFREFFAIATLLLHFAVVNEISIFFESRDLSLKILGLLQVLGNAGLGFLVGGVVGVCGLYFFGEQNILALHFVYLFQLLGVEALDVVAFVLDQLVLRFRVLQFLKLLVQACDFGDLELAGDLHSLVSQLLRRDSDLAEDLRGVAAELEILVFQLVEDGVHELVVLLQNAEEGLQLVCLILRIEEVAAGGAVFLLREGCEFLLELLEKNFEDLEMILFSLVDNFQKELEIFGVFLKLFLDFFFDQFEQTLDLPQDSFFAHFDVLQELLPYLLLQGHILGVELLEQKQLALLNQLSQLDAIFGSNLALLDDLVAQMILLPAAILANSNSVL